MPDENSILDRIRELVDEEHRLRQALGEHQVDATEEQLRIAELARALDQCWDLLRQRRARVEAGQSPTDAAARPTGTVEGYQQ